MIKKFKEYSLNEAINPVLISMKNIIKKFIDSDPILESEDEQQIFNETYIIYQEEGVYNMNDSLENIVYVCVKHAVATAYQNKTLNKLKGIVNEEFKKWN